MSFNDCFNETVEKSFNDAKISYWFKKKTWYRKLIALPFSFVIGLVGLFWFFERII
jgi:lysophospholipid acyltransferase (LPLAT)-like uncharacterized protein